MKPHESPPLPPALLRLLDDKPEEYHYRQPATRLSFGVRIQIGSLVVLAAWTGWCLYCAGIIHF